MASSSKPESKPAVAVADDTDGNVFRSLDMVSVDVEPTPARHVFEELKKSTEAPRQALAVMEKGTLLTKVRSIGRRYRRTFYIDPQGLVLRYRDSHKNQCWRMFHPNSHDQSRISIKQIKEVREGANPDTSRRGSKQPAALNSVPCFTLVIGDDLRTLDLIAPNTETKETWLRGLRYLMSKRAGANVDEEELMWIKERFDEADKNSNGKLDKKEVFHLMMSLNVCPEKSSYVKHHVKVTEVDVEGFVQLYRKFSHRTELDVIFHKYSKNKDCMGVDELASFFKKEQNQTFAPIVLKEIIEKSESCPKLKERVLLSSAGFLAMFASELMNIRKPLCRTVYQDMTRPLNEYFINSSHNTYLEKHQLYGYSRVEQYVRVLKNRGRCVELDVWDGIDNEPCIYHGYTLTEKIVFKDAIAAINEHAFQKSPFPIILSIENHCSIEQQKQMAKYLQQTFGNKLYTEPLPDDATCLPSPEQLKGRVIVKNKKLPPDVSDGDDYSTDEEDEAAEIEDEEIQKKVKKRDLPPGMQLDREESQQHHKSKSKSAKQHKTKLTIELSNCVVICQAATFVSFEDSARRLTFAHMSSFGEDKALKLATQYGGREFVKHNARQLSRIYPAGRRTDSSNYDPVPMWMAGCQMVALNFQTRDKPLLVNYGFFEDNGACGYVLKPDFMREPKVDFNQDGPFPETWQKTLKIQIISGYMLPKKIGDDKHSILDPYVEVEIHGVPIDRVSQQTRTIMNNGFNPVWNEELTFTVNVPQLALVMFQIIDHETTSGDVLVAQYCLPMRCMQTGYRMIALRDMKGEVVGPSSLFVRVSISPEN